MNNNINYGNYGNNNYNGNNMNNDNNGFKKKSGSGIIIALCIIIILVLCGYIAYDKGLFGSLKNENTTTNNSSNTNKIENTNEGENITPPNSSNTTPDSNPKYSFDISKCSNCDSEYSYELNASGYIAYATLKEDNKSVDITIDYDKVKDTGVEVNATGQKGYTLSFSKKVADIIYGTYGLDMSYETLIFLMEDGTVEYLPLLDAAIKGKIESYGQVENLTNIVKFYPNISASRTSGAGGYVTTLAQSSDGTIYDIMTILSKTGNYSYSG